MAEDAFDNYLSEINKAYLKGDSTEHTHRPALKALIEKLAKKITATNEPKRTECGAPDYVVSRRTKGLDQNFGYIEAKDIGTNLKQAEKTEQIKKRYLPSLNNFILTDYIEFRWYINGEKQLTAILAEEKAGKFKTNEQQRNKVNELLEAFLSQQPEKIKIAKELATKMGHKAKLMRDIIKGTFQQEEKAGTLHGQFEAFKEVLLHDLTEEQFADMYAQTICYGLFTARCHIEDMTVFGKDKFAAFHGMDEKAKELTREHAAYLLPKTNPFFRDIFGDIAGPKLDDRIVWLVDDLVELLKQADMGIILRDFARHKKRKDPVVHFYETFLAEYDPKLKKKRGVYYTPDEVVSYIVRSVDYLLKEKFGLKRGLADESKIKVNSRLRGNDKKRDSSASPQNDKRKNKNQNQEVHKVLILDPAVGTGTFLFEVIDQIYEKFKRQKGMWSGYVKEHLLPRIFGFELMMAPYAVCHMKLGLQLAETGYDFASEERLGVYLTNTLEEAEEISKTLFAQYLSKEARAANRVKRELPIMVVMGNPPYSVSSQNKGEYIDQLMERYKEAVRDERNIQPLSDDYIKFLRFAHNHIEETGVGIIGMITNNAYLSGLIHRGMREELIKSFDDIYILDLHGSTVSGLVSPKGMMDKNVFDIKPGVAVCLLVKDGGRNNRCEIKYADVWGSRDEKRSYLMSERVDSTQWQMLEPKAPYFFFVPKDFAEESNYEKGKSIKEVFRIYQRGVATRRDHFMVAFERNELENRMNTFSGELSEKEIEAQFGVKSTKYWSLEDARRIVRGQKEIGKNIRAYAYRPFDNRSILYVPEMIERGDAAHNVMQHMLRTNKAILCFRRIRDETLGCVFVADKLVDKTILSAKDNATVFPLYVYECAQAWSLFEESGWEPGIGDKIPNLSPEFVEEFSRRVKLEFVSDGAGDLKNTYGPEDILHYIYGAFHSTEYRRRYAEFLKIDFPRVPMPKSKALFKKLCDVGEELVKLHLMEAPILEDDKKQPAFPIEGNSVVEKGYPQNIAHADNPQKGRVYINKEQYFEGVNPDVWEFHIGGYQVCEKWLKDRRERELSFDDKKHYQKIVVALGETIRLMKEPCLSEMFD